MLKRELEASKSVTTHLRFLRSLAEGSAASPALRDELVAHIAEEEGEHQAHLARLVPALESLASTLEGGGSAPPVPPASLAPPGGLTVGSLVGERPWYARHSG
jgi:hypothetical protein